MSSPHNSQGDRIAALYAYGWADAMTSESPTSRSRAGQNIGGLASRYYFENVDKADLQRHGQRAQTINHETSSSQSPGWSSRLFNEERRIPRSQETGVLERRSAHEREAKDHRSSIKSGQRPSYEHSASVPPTQLTASGPEHSASQRYSPMEHQARQSPQPPPRPPRPSTVPPERTAHELPAYQQTPPRTSQLSQESLDIIGKLKTVQGITAALEATRLINPSREQTGKTQPFPDPRPPKPPKVAERKSDPVTRPPQSANPKPVPVKDDPFFTQRAEFHLQEWLDETDKGDWAAAADNLAVVENMIVERWGSIQNAPKEYISGFMTPKIMSLILYDQDQEALELVKLMEPVKNQRREDDGNAGGFFVAEIVLHIRLGNWDTARAKCSDFLHPGFIKNTDPRVDMADQSLGFWLMAEVLKATGKSVEAKFYQSQIKAGLSIHSWYRWAVLCLRKVGIKPMPEQPAKSTK
ncbi:hypothetical protein TWF281_003739 [Arthrobotrys megalospora]